MTPEPLTLEEIGMLRRESEAFGLTRPTTGLLYATRPARPKAAPSKPTRRHKQKSRHRRGRR